MASTCLSLHDHDRFTVMRAGLTGGVLAFLLATATPSRSDEPARVLKPAGDVNAATAEAQTQRVRELIYFFRNYRVFSRDEEWAQTIRELATMGKPAVPELVAELDRTDRDSTLRSLAFTLRAIGDPRAVPALIRAIPKALRPPGSDCGLSIADPELRAFMLAHQNYKDEKGAHVASGRPVNEIISALERITGHREPPGVGENDPLRHVFLGGTAEQQVRQLGLFEERQRLWQTWWTEHSGEFVTKDELASVELARRDVDVIAAAGLARFGPLFPTGAGVSLGPVRMLRLDTSMYANGKSHLDFDTGRVFEQYEGVKTAEWGSPPDFGARITSWYRQKGIDTRCQGSVDSIDMQLWLIDDSRWETLDEEITKGGPLTLGREATSGMARFDKTWTDFKYDQLATFLFTTREGGRGIVQVFPKDADSDRQRVRYRMWSTADAKPADQSTVKPNRTRTPGTPFAKPQVVMLEMPAQAREFLLDIDTGKKFRSPEFLKPDDFVNAWQLPRDSQFTEWSRANGVDVFGHVTNIQREAAAAGAPARPSTALQLIGLEMVEVRILPRTFDELTVEEARDLFERMPEQKNAIASMMVDENLKERPDTFAFRTREGGMGLLQLAETEKVPGTLTLRYRLERK